MDPVKEVKLHIHKKHLMSPMKSGQMGYCCGIKFGAISDGYYCSECELFFHKICSDVEKYIVHPSPKCNQMYLSLKSLYWGEMRCLVCGEKFREDTRNYACPYQTCSTALHLYCVWNLPPKIIEVPQNHEHKLKLEMRQSCFTCVACGKEGDGYPYKCHECDLTFHVNCERYDAEVNHPSHSLHPLKLFKGEPPAYTGGTCRLCAKSLGNYEVFYHCSKCNFSLDLGCARHPPVLYLNDLNIHDHQLSLMPKSISFTCTTCGLNGDRSPYVCLQCDFTAHNDCSGFPWVININRHDHRVSRTSLIGVVNSRCGVCQKKMDWSCGGYSCKRCPNFVYHTKCATREDVSECEEMKDKPEEAEDIEPFKVIDENTIQHFLHKEHYLRLDKSCIFVEDRSCFGCAYPIYHHSFYSCMSCNFMLHEKCANLPTGKRHVLSNWKDKLQQKPTLFPWHPICRACGTYYNTFTYSGQYSLDVRCTSVTEPFIHQSHPHSLYYTTPEGVCSACNKKARCVLRCVEDDCGYVLDFHCALLPYEVKHRVDDHFLSLRYGEDSGNKASGKYWCNICERETDPKSWFYTSRDNELTLHIHCVLGDTTGLLPGSEFSTNYGERRHLKVVRNNSISRPHCSECKSRCIFPVILKRLDKFGNEYFCSVECSGLRRH